MDEAKRQRALVWVLVFAVLFGLLNLKSITSIGKKRTIADLEPGLSPPAAANATPAVPVSFAYERLTPAKEARLTLGFGRNPFQRGAERQAASAGPLRPEFLVSAISLKGGTAFAVINGRVLQAGEEIEGYRVQTISEGRVVLSKDGSLWTYSLRGE